MPNNEKNRIEKRAARKRRSKPMNLDKPRISPEETREYCGNIFSDYSLRRSRCTGLLLGLPAPAYLRIGSRICYERKVIDDWIDKHAMRLNNTAQNAA